VRILSWNIRQGGGQRLDRIAAAIKRYRPQLVVLNEVRARTLPALREHLAGAGVPFMEDTNPNGFEHGTLVGARQPLHRVQSCQPASILPHGLLEVKTHTGCVIGAVYGPMVTRQHRPFWDALVTHTTAMVNTDYLLIGDFNTGEAAVDAYLKRMAGSDQFLAMRAAGYVDLWRAHNRTTEHTWYSFGRGGVVLNGFRIDHALASPSLAKRLTSCRYSHAERKKRLSDHSVLLVELRDD
jgi:exonuclease III